MNEMNEMKPPCRLDMPEPVTCMTRSLDAGIVQSSKQAYAEYLSHIPMPLNGLLCQTKYQLLIFEILATFITCPLIHSLFHFLIPILLPFLNNVLGPETGFEYQREDWQGPDLCCSKQCWASELPGVKALPMVKLLR
jgi:hypothetical protein